MNPYTHRALVPTALVLLLALQVACQKSSTSIVFDATQDESEIHLRISDLEGDLPTDWSSYGALVIEMRATSPQRFTLKIYNGEGDEDYSRVLFHPYPSAWIRAAIPISELSAAPTTGHDMAAVGNRSRPGYHIGLWGPFVPLDDVRAIAFAMKDPIAPAEIEIRSIQVVQESPGDAVLEPLPLVDKFGQWIPADWPGKVKTEEELKAAWAAEEEALSAGEFGYSRYGGYVDTKATATGFFRVENIDGRWWFVDPDGHLFLSIGSDVMRTEMVTRTVGREDHFEELPPASLRDASPRDGDPGASFFTWNLFRRFGDDWVARWVDFTIRRMENWGLNTVANWSDPALWNAKRKAYVIPLERWETEVSYLGLPDVYSEEFLNSVDEAARRQCEPRRDDPWLLGYFLANEPPFPQKELQTIELILEGPPTATRAALEKWLAEGDTPERRKEFIDNAFDRYIQTTSQAVRKYDPNHLNLGMRSGGSPTAAEIAAARAFDVYSVNIYDYQVSQERISQISRLTGKPVIIGEFHFGTPGRGLSSSLVQVKDFEERGVAYRYYVEQAFSQPELIGTHWFQWADQPATGRFDGESYNIGLVDTTDRPYEELIDALKTTHRRLFSIHRGEQEPFSTQAAAN